jgi:hypothetical protein
MPPAAATSEREEAITKRFIDCRALKRGDGCTTRRGWQPEHAASGEMLTVASQTLEAHACHDGLEHPVAVRVGATDGAVYLDLADDKWRAVEIGADGWRIVTDPPVRFLRPRGTLALPLPVRGGSLDELRPFLNVATPDDFVLRHAGSGDRTAAAADAPSPELQSRIGFVFTTV